jgi:hypothetical protein
LEELGLAENTVVFFWSDHGDGLPRGKRWVYDSGTKVPFIVRWPGVIEPGSVNDQLVSSIDFGATVLSIAGVPLPAYMEGKAILGEQESEPRDFVVSARDRFDEDYDMVRSVRDKKYRYVRNYYTHKPGIIWVPYRNQSPIMKELLRLHAEGELTQEQALWFSETRQPEELFDCEADPHQLNNLASKPEYKEKLIEMRTILDDWITKTGDMGFISEEKMVNSWYPNGIRPSTSPVHFIPNTEGNRNANRIEDSEIKGPATLSLYSATQGASIAWTREKGENPGWKIYTGPIPLHSGENFIRAKAIRYGYFHSDETSIRIKVNG